MGLKRQARILTQRPDGGGPRVPDLHPVPGAKSSDLPIQSSDSHFLEGRRDLPKISNGEKALFVFTTIAAMGGFATACALFVTFHTNLGYFSLGISAFFVGVWVIAADGYRYRVLTQMLESKKSIPVKPDLAKNSAIHPLMTLGISVRYLHLKKNYWNSQAYCLKIK